MEDHKPDMNYLYRSSKINSEYIDKMRSMCLYSSYQTKPNLALSNQLQPLYKINGFPIKLIKICAVSQGSCQKRDREKNPATKYFIDPIEEEISKYTTALPSKNIKQSDASKTSLSYDDLLSEIVNF